MQSHKIYKSIDSLPVWNFAKVMDTNDLRYLLILDYYDDLPEFNVEPIIWEQIILEFAEHSDPQRMKNYIRDLSALISKRRQYQLIIDSAYFLCFKKDEEIIRILENNIKQFDPIFEFKHTKESGIDEIDYAKSVDKAYEKGRSLLSSIELKSHEFNSRYANKENVKFDLYKNIDALQRFNKIIINPKEISVKQFIVMNQSMITDLKKHVRR